jgi:hypothetical protein
MARVKQPVKPATKALVDKQRKRVRDFVLALPNVTEKISHGHPAYFVKKKAFAYFLNDHHGDGRLALWCIAPPGAQAMLVGSDADVYFVPPYVGVSGWIGVRLDRGAEWPQIAAILESAHDTRSTKR